MTSHTARLFARIVASNVPIVSLSDTNGTYTVQPPDLQAAAQPIIDAFDPDDPAHEQADLDVAVKAAVDTERLTSAVVWTILKQMFPADTDAQTKTKYGVARTRIIEAFKAQSWK